MRLRALPAVLVLVLVALAAAPAAGQSPPRPPEYHGDDPDRSIADGSAQRRLAAARRRWRRAGIHDYRFALIRRCVCSGTGVIAVFVHDDRPLNAPRGISDVATIGRLQRVVQGAIDDEVHDLSVRYDRRGIPRAIGIDGHRMVADDEVAYRVTRFWRGLRGGGGPDTAETRLRPFPVPL